MSGNKTVIKPSAPRFGINEIVYLRESAIRGFIQPIMIAQPFFDPKISELVYRYREGVLPRNIINLENGRVAFRPATIGELTPFVLNESEIVDLCEALDIQVAFLEKELLEAQDELARVCGTGQELPDPTFVVIDVDMVVRPSDPRFGFHEVVYLAETAESVGRLERLRVDGIEFDPLQEKWVYTIMWRQKPGENMTVGDRIDLRRSAVAKYGENELLKVCEAVPLRVQFLDNVLNKAVAARNQKCTEGTG